MRFPVRYESNGGSFGIGVYAGDLGIFDGARVVGVAVSVVRGTLYVGRGFPRAKPRRPMAAPGAGSRRGADGRRCDDPLTGRPTQGDGVTCPRCRIVNPTPIRGAARCSACGTVLR